MRRFPVLFACLMLAGCGDYPRDPEATLERARGGALVVGVSPEPPWTSGDGRGVEERLVLAFAAQHGLRVEWRAGGETRLLRDLEAFRIALVVAGLTDDTPWKDRVALSKPYLRTQDPDGAVRRVIAVPPGENALLVALERFLASEPARAILNDGAGR